MLRSPSCAASIVAVSFAVACSSASGGGTGAETSSSTGRGTGGSTTAGSGTGGAGTGGMAAGTGGSSVAGTGGAGPDGGSNACSVDGNPGECMMTSVCAGLADHTSYPGYCPGPADIECCTKTPNVADNPPVPAGWMLMQQSAVTPAMTMWAVMILDDPTDYPMFATTMMTFGTQLVMARVEWHPPDFQNSVVHRGVTLYVPG